MDDFGNKLGCCFGHHCPPSSCNKVCGCGNDGDYDAPTFLARKANSTDSELIVG